MPKEKTRREIDNEISRLEKAKNGDNAGVIRAYIKTLQRKRKTARD